MELKHFSHHHGLVFYQPPQGSHDIHCSGCKSRASDDIYVCWQCNYFLHGQCFAAARSIRHPSHPHHPLTLVPFPTYPSGSFICNTCHIAGDAFSYTCSACEFDIHLHCAHFNPSNPSFDNPMYPPPIQTNHYPSYPPPPHQSATIIPNHYTQNYNSGELFHQTPVILQNQNPSTNFIRHFSHPHVLKPMEIEKKNAKVCSGCECELSGSAQCCTEAHCTFNLHKMCFDSPRELRHKSHPQHELTLLDEPPYRDGGFTCNACLKDGRAFVYTCGACSYDLHIDCGQWPDKVTRPDHNHALTLYYSSLVAETRRGVDFTCDVCKNPVHELAWIYYCRECDFGTHLECVTSGFIKSTRVVSAN